MNAATSQNESLTDAVALIAVCKGSVALMEIALALQMVASGVTEVPAEARKARRGHAPPPASKKLDDRSRLMRDVRCRDACPANDRGPGGWKLQALLFCCGGGIVGTLRAAGKLYAARVTGRRRWSEAARAVRICAGFGER
jgi:hypothetical protein